MSEKTVEFTIAPGKPVGIEAKGFEGRSCREATALFERALGGEVVSTIDKVAETTSTAVKPTIRASNGA